MVNFSEELSVFILERGECEEEQQDSLDSHVYLGSMFFASWLPRHCLPRGGGRAHGHVGLSVIHETVEHFIALEALAAGL